MQQAGAILTILITLTYGGYRFITGAIAYAEGQMAIWEGVATLRAESGGGAGHERKSVAGDVRTHHGKGQ